MYELEAFLSFVIAYAYVQGVLHGRRAGPRCSCAARPDGLRAQLGALPVRRSRGRDRRVRARAAEAVRRSSRSASLVLYVPWLPTLLSQARHTGAPWSTAPSFHDLVLAPGAVSRATRRSSRSCSPAAPGSPRSCAGEPTRAAVVLALATLAGVTVALAWISSQISPAWTARYFAVILGPLLLLAARGLVRARPARLRRARRGRLPLACTCVHDDKENARSITARRRALHPPGRARHLDPPGAGAGAALLPGAGLRGARRRSARSTTRSLRLARRASTRLARTPASRRWTRCSPPSRRGRTSL